MGKVINFIYGGILLFLAIDISFTKFIPIDLAPFAVAGMGIVILLTPIGSPVGSFAPRSPFNWARRWIFGFALVLIGLSDFIPGNFTFLNSISTNSIAGIFALVIFGAIYLVSAFGRTRNIQVGSI